MSNTDPIQTGEGVISGDTQNMRNSEEQTEEQHRTHQNLGSG